MLKEILEIIVTKEICPDCHDTNCKRVPTEAQFDDLDNYLMPECSINAVCDYGNDCAAHQMSLWLV